VTTARRTARFRGQFSLESIREGRFRAFPPGKTPHHALRAVRDCGSPLEVADSRAGRTRHGPSISECPVCDSPAGIMPVIWWREARGGRAPPPPAGVRFGDRQSRLVGGDTDSRRESEGTPHDGYY
jgi:hypothetical protein